MPSLISDRTSPNSNHPYPPAVKEQTGSWLFRHRTALPLPIAAAILLIPAGHSDRSAELAAAGVAITVLGEAIRLWGVQHIGAISRTRIERVGPLVDTGPFAHVRNPLYVGNILLWVGFAITARLPGLASIAFVVFAIEYHFIVRWEERLLAERLGDRYRDYVARVPRWFPTGTRRARTTEDDDSAVSANAFSWRETLFSERGTLIAMSAGYLLLWLKARF